MCPLQNRRVPCLTNSIRSTQHDHHRAPSAVGARRAIENSLSLFSKKSDSRSHTLTDPSHDPIDQVLEREQLHQTSRSPTLSPDTCTTSYLSHAQTKPSVQGIRAACYQPATLTRALSALSSALTPPVIVSHRSPIISFHLLTQTTRTPLPSLPTLRDPTSRPHDHNPQQDSTFAAQRPPYILPLPLITPKRLSFIFI